LGYSQSMSRPSKPRSRINWTAEEAKFERPAEVEAGVAKLEEYVQPPMERRIFRERFWRLRRLSCLRQP
jgi:hypothetical protein